MPTTSNMLVRSWSGTAKSWVHGSASCAVVASHIVLASNEVTAMVAPRRRGMGPGELWRQLTAGTRNGAIVVDSRALYAHDYTDEDAAVTAVLHELTASPT